jgi:hypothetical protein
MTSWPCRGPRVSFWSWCHVTFARRGPQRRCQAVFLESNGWLEEVLHEQAHRGLFVAIPKTGEGVGCLVVSLVDMMMFETIKLLLKFLTS